MSVPVTHFQTSLTVAMTASQVTVSLNSIQTKDTPPHTLVMADFGSIFYAVIEPGSSNEEIISFTGITDNLDGSGILTGVVRGLKYYGLTDGVLSGNAKAHASNVSVIITNVKNVYALYTSREDNETITGTWTFTNPKYPRMDTATPPPTDNEQFATKKYVDDTAIAGAPDASTTVKGISKLSVAPVLATNPIAVGDNDNRVPTSAQTAALVGDNTDIPVGSGNKFVTQTGLQKQAENYAVSATGTDAYSVTLAPVPTSYAAGMVVRFKADVANTGAATINVNGLGVKSITKNGNIALEDNDIKAGQVITLVYEGVVGAFQIQSLDKMNQANANTLTAGSSSDAESLHTHTNLVSLTSQFTTTKNAADGSTSTVYAHGLTVAPRSIQAFMLAGNTSSASQGAWNNVQNASSCVFSTSAVGAGVRTNVDNELIHYEDSNGSQKASIASVDATNITVTWTKTGTPAATMEIMFVAKN